MADVDAKNDAKNDAKTDSATPAGGSKKASSKKTSSKTSKAGPKKGKSSSKKGNSQVAGKTPEGAAAPPSPFMPVNQQATTSHDLAATGEVRSGEGGAGIRAIRNADGSVDIGVASGTNMPASVLAPVIPKNFAQPQSPSQATAAGAGGPSHTGQSGFTPQPSQPLPFFTAPQGEVVPPPGTQTIDRHGKAKEAGTGKTAKAAEVPVLLFYCYHPNHIADYRHENRFHEKPADQVQGLTCPECGGQGNQYQVADKTVPAVVAQAHRV